MNVKGILYTAAVVLAVLVVDRKLNLSGTIAGFIPGGKA